MIFKVRSGAEKVILSVTISEGDDVVTINEVLSPAAARAHGAEIIFAADAVEQAHAT